MNIIASLSSLALRPVAEGAFRSVAMTAGAVVADKAVRFLAERFSDQSQRLIEALGNAQDRAWKTLEMALAGDSFWQRCKSMLQKGEDASLQAHFRAVIAGLDPKITGGDPEAFRGECLTELRAARKAGHLNAGAITTEQLAEQAAKYANFDEPTQQLAAERRQINDLANALTMLGYPSLGLLVGPRGEDPGLLVRAVRYYFRRAVEDDQQLFQGLSFSAQEEARAAQDEGFAALQRLFVEQGQRVESLLNEVSAVVVQTHAAVLDLQEELREQGAQNKALYESIIAMQKKLDMMHTEVRPRDSLSIRTDAEKQMVKEVIAKYRDLPPDEKAKLPALLNAIGQLELASGSFQEAKTDFATVATMVADKRAQGQAHMNAYKAALEARDWNNALRELIAAIKLDAKTFAPFHVGKYVPQRILGAGGFGVAFLCKHKYMESQVVVKTLFDEQIELQIDQVFTEAKALSQLAHPNIVRIQDCGYTDPSAKSRPFIVMDYFDGVTLEQYVKEKGALKVDQWLKIAEQVAAGLKAAHDKGILHRDVKPANMLIKNENGQLKVMLIDFGLAMPAQAMRGTSRQSKTLAGATIAGTLDYGSPEQMGKLPGVAVTPASDVYGFGKTACYALFQTTQPVLKHWQSLPSEQAELLSRCLSEQPKERPRHFGEVLAALRAEEAIPDAVVIEEKKKPVDIGSLFDQVPASRRPRDRDDEEPRSRDRDRPRREREEEPVRRSGRPAWPFYVAGGVAGMLLLVFLIVMLTRGNRDTPPSIIVKNTQENPAPNYVPPKTNPPPINNFPPKKNPPTPPTEVAARDGKIYLDDLEPISQSDFPSNWKLGRNGKTGEWTNSLISVGGKKYPRGLGMHPPVGQPVRISYKIPSADRFIGAVAINDGSIGLNGQVIFGVYGDGTKLWQSRAITATNDPQYFDFAIKGVRELELRVYPPNGEGDRANFGAHAVWLDPYLLTDSNALAKNDPSPPRVDPMPPRVEPMPPAGPVSLPWKGNRCYLAELEPIDPPTGDLKIRYGANDPKLVRGGKPLPKSFLVPFARGAGDGASSVRFRLDDKVLAFQTTVGFEDGHREFFKQQTTFEVYGDGKELWKSKTISKNADQDICRIAVEGVKELELRIVTDKSFACSPVWIDPLVESTQQVAPVVEWKVGEAKKYGELTVSELPPNPNSLVGQMLLSADGQSVYILETGGLIRRLSLTDWSEQARFDIGFTAKSFTTCKFGVLVLVETPQTEMVLLDAKTLQRVRKAPMAGAIRVHSQPEQPFAIVEASGGGSTPRVGFVDASRLTVIGQATDAELGGAAGTLGATYQHHLSGDGRAMVAYTDVGELVRWTLTYRTATKSTVTARYEQKGPPIITGRDKKLAMSGDGLAVALIGPDGNRTSDANHPNAEPNSIFLYDVQALNRPTGYITPGRGITALAWSGRSGPMFGNNAAKELIRFGDKGMAPTGEFTLPGGATRFICTNKTGTRLLVLTDKKLLGVEVK